MELILVFPPDDILTSGRGKNDVDFESHLPCLKIEDHGFALTKAEEINTMISGEDDSAALNGRLRPRKSTATTPNPPCKFSSKPEKVAPDKPKRNSSPFKASPNKHDDLTAKADSSSIAQFLCPLCDKKFSTKVSFKRHTRRLHQLINCIYCNYSDAPSDEDVMRHMVDNHPNQYFACLVCNTRYNSTTELAEHKLTACVKPKSAYNRKLRQKNSSVSQNDQETIKADQKTPVKSKEPTLEPEFNGLVISCELKPSLIHDAIDIEDKITTNLILPSNINNPGMEQNTVLILDDIQWNKRIPPNFSFRNADADQILSRLGVVHRSPRVGESNRKEWLKLMDDSSQKFEKCFDTSFYSRVASNVQENLAKFLDGSFNFSPDPDKIIKTRKSKSSAIINTAEGFPILLPYEQYSRNRFDGYIPRAIAPKHKWKWDSSENDKNMIIDANVIKRDNHVDNCIITLVSSLDIWTQLRMRHKFESIFCKASTEKSEKQNTVGNQLKEILESREIPCTSRAVEQPSSSTAMVAVSDTLDFPSVLGLAARGRSVAEVKLTPAVLSGEWVRPRCYVCCACGEQTREARALSTHVTTHHPNAQVQHYEIVGESLLNADILKHLYVPPSQMSNRTRPLRGFRDCTKCKKSITMEDMHQHMLDCAGDTPTVRRKCRSRLFGVRRRRPRLADNPISRKKLRKDLRARQNQKTLMRARPRIRTEVGDAETIRRMIADLPAKRHRPANEPSVTQQVLRPRRKLDKQRNKIKIKRLATLERPTRKLTNNTESNEPPIIDEDDQPLKPKTKIEPEKVVHTKKRFSTRVVASRNKKKSTTAKELPTYNEKRQDAPSGRGIQQNQLSRENTTQRLNINSRGNDNGKGENRDSSEKNDGDHRDKSPSENRDKHKGDFPDPPQLKHSINNITALTNKELHQKNSPDKTKTKGTPSDTRQTFLENEVGSSILDKPPLQKNQNKTSEKKRLSLLNCIEKIKSQQKGDNMFHRSEMISQDRRDNEHPNLSLLDPHPAVICRTRDESGAANNVIPGNIDYQRYPVPSCLGTQPTVNETIVLNTLVPCYDKSNSDLECSSPKAKPGRRKSSAVRVSPARIEYDQTSQLHYNQLLQQQQWNAMHNLQLIQPALLAPPIAPQRLPYPDNMLMQMHASEAIKNGYPVQYKNMGFPITLPYNAAGLHYDGRTDHALQGVETSSYSAVLPISPQAWARESAHLQAVNNEHAIPVSLTIPSTNLLMPTPRRSAKRESESSDTDVYSSAQGLRESTELRNSSESTANIFMPPKSKINRDTYFNNKRPLTRNVNEYNRTPDYINCSADNYINNLGNQNNSGKAVAKNDEIYRTTQTQTTAESDRYYISPVRDEERLPITHSSNIGNTINHESHGDSVPKSLYSNNSNKKVFHERYLAEHPHLSPSVPTESQAAKITTSANESAILESYDMYTHDQSVENNIQSVQLNSITRLDLNNHTPYIEVGDERDESKALLDEPDSSLNEQPLDLSGKSATTHGAKSNDYADINLDTFTSNKSYEDVPTDLSLKDVSIKTVNHDFQNSEKPRNVEQNNAISGSQTTINSALCKSNKEIATKNNHDEAVWVPNVENIEKPDMPTITTQLSLNNPEEISSHPPSDLLDREIFLARERVRLLENFKQTCDKFHINPETFTNSDGKQITKLNLLNQDAPQKLGSMKKKYTADLPTVILPNSAQEFNNENTTTVGENKQFKEAIRGPLNAETVNKIALFSEPYTDNLNKIKEQNSKLEEIICSILPTVEVAAAKLVAPENLVAQNVTKENDFTPTMSDASSITYDGKLTVNTGSLPISSILPKKRHSPSARMNSQETQTKSSIIINQASTHSSKSKTIEPEPSNKIMTGSSYVPEDISKKSSDIAYVSQNKDEVSDKIIDLTEDELNNRATKTEENSSKLPIINITPKPHTTTKHYNEKTASLRAVRIKTFPSARKSLSEDLQHVSKETYNHNTPLLDIAQRELSTTLNSTNSSTRKMKDYNETQQINAQNTENHDTSEVELRQSSDKVTKPMSNTFDSNANFETKLESLNSIDHLEGSKEKNDVTDSVMTKLPSIEHISSTESNRTMDKSKEAETENNIQENINHYNANNKIENISNSLINSSLHDSLITESSSLSINENDCTVLKTEPAQQSEMSRDNSDLCRIDNQLEIESAENSNTTKLSMEPELANKEDSDDDDVCLASIATYNNPGETNGPDSHKADSTTTISNKKNVKPFRKDKKSRKKKTTKKKNSKKQFFKSRSLRSAIFHKQQSEFKVSEQQNANSYINKTDKDSVEIKTVTVGNKTDINKENINEKVTDTVERDCDNKEKPDEEDSNDIHQGALAKNRNRPRSPHSHNEEIDDVHQINNTEDVTVNDAESLQEPGSTTTLNNDNNLNDRRPDIRTHGNCNVEENDPSSTQIVPVTKKQLIFSKLLHEENKQEEIKKCFVPNTSDDDDEVKIDSKISTKRKKCSKKSKNKKKKTFLKHNDHSLIDDSKSVSENNDKGHGSIEKEEILKFDKKINNTSPKRKRQCSSLIPNTCDENITNAKKTKLVNQNDDTFLPHLETPSNSANKVTNGANTDVTKCENQPEKASTSPEIRTACYNRPINKLTNFASINVKNHGNYDPYDIDLEIDMAETKRPVVKRKGNNRTVSGNTNSKTKKLLIHGDDKLRHEPDTKAVLVSTTTNDSDSSISDTPLQKYVEEKEKSKIEALKSPDSKKLEIDTSISALVNTTNDDNMVLSKLPSTQEPNLTENNDETIPEINLEIINNTNIGTNSIDHSDKTNEINEVVALVKDFIAEQKKISKDNQDNEQINNPSEGKPNKKQKKNVRSFSAGKTDAINSDKIDKQLSSDKYMEVFGFYAFRQPRNANLLATKKISETYNMIENDDTDFHPRERQRKHSHTESRKIVANGAQSSRTTPEINNTIDKRISLPPSTSSLNIAETNTVDEPNLADDDGEVDLITAQRMLESEEIRKLERDLYFGFKEAAEANAGKTFGLNYLRAEETRTENINQAIVDPVDSNADTNNVESCEPASSDLNESGERSESPEMPESPEGVLIDKPLMYPEEEVNIYEDKYDIIKRRREASANAKQLLKVDKPKKSNNGIRKKKSDRKNKRSSKKPVYQVSQVRTKGALKGFDGIKISIATQDLNMPPSVSPSYQNGSKKQKESTGKARTLSNSSNKNDAGLSSVAVAMSDIYEFQDDDRPVAKGYKLSSIISKSRDKNRSTSSEDEEKKHKSNQYGKEKLSLPCGEGNNLKKLKELDKKRYKGKGKGKRSRNKDDDLDDETPRELAKRIRKDKLKEARYKSKVNEPENVQNEHDHALAEDNVVFKDKNISAASASSFDNDEPFYESDSSVPGTSGFVPDRNDESSYDSDSSSPPLSSVLKGPYACTCLSEIDSDDSETERGCAHRSCRYSHLNAAKNAVMGKIFKNNAVRCEKIDEKPESPQPKPDLDRLFDSLLEPTNDVVSTIIVPIAGPSSANLFYYTTTQVNSQSQISKSLQENKLSNLDEGSRSPNSTKNPERVARFNSLFNKEKAKIDDASNISNNFNENTEESTDNGRYVMVSDKPVQTEDTELLARPETVQDGADDESSDFIVLKRKNNSQKTRGTQTKRLSKPDVETSSNAVIKITKKNRKANKKHKSHHKRSKTSEDEQKPTPSGSKITSASPHNSKTKQARKCTKTETNSRRGRPSPKTETNSRGERHSPKHSKSRKSVEETREDNSANSSGSPRQRASQKGVAEGRARRKCTVGKQNVLAEHWSSSESDGGAGPSRVRGKRNSVVKRSGRGKKDQVCKRFKNETEERPRAPVLKLRARTACSLANQARLRGHEERHGWIVGQSGKKLMSMLAYSKMLQQLHLQRLRLRRRRRRRRQQEREEEEEDDEREGEEREEEVQREEEEEVQERNAEDDDELETQADTEDDDDEDDDDDDK